jgi:hypothetical protein
MNTIDMQDVDRTNNLVIRQAETIIRLKNQLATLLDAVTYDWSETPECNVSAGRRLDAAIQSSSEVLEVTR